MVLNKYQRVFKHGDGLLVLNELIHVFQSTMLFDKDSVTNTAFKLGQDDVIKYILARVDNDIPDGEERQ